MPKRPLRGHVALVLIRQLAQGTRTHADLGAEHGVSERAIGQFATRNATAIEEVRADVVNEFAGMWIANKVARVAEYERDVEDINDSIPTARKSDRPRLYGVKHRALRGAAEELGQLAPTRIDVDHRVRYQVVGVDTEQLR